MSSVCGCHRLSLTFTKSSTLGWFGSLIFQRLMHETCFKTGNRQKKVEKVARNTVKWSELLSFLSDKTTQVQNSASQAHLPLLTPLRKMTDDTVLAATQTAKNLTKSKPRPLETSKYSLLALFKVCWTDLKVLRVVADACGCLLVVSPSQFCCLSIGCSDTLITTESAPPFPGAQWRAKRSANEEAFNVEGEKKGAARLRVRWRKILKGQLQQFYKLICAVECVPARVEKVSSISRGSCMTYVCIHRPGSLLKKQYPMGFNGNITSEANTSSWYLHVLFSKPLVGNSHFWDM